MSTATMPSRWHSEPGYSKLMDCIRAVRIHGQSPRDACDKLKISTRTFRRYVSASRSMQSSKFYIPMTEKERAKLAKRKARRQDDALKNAKRNGAKSRKSPVRSTSTTGHNASSASRSENDGTGVTSGAQVHAPTARTGGTHNAISLHTLGGARKRPKLQQTSNLPLSPPLGRRLQPQQQHHHHVQQAQQHQQHNVGQSTDMWEPAQAAALRNALNHHRRPQSAGSSRRATKTSRSVPQERSLSGLTQQTPLHDQQFATNEMLLLNSSDPTATSNQTGQPKFLRWRAPGWESWADQSPNSVPSAVNRGGDVRHHGGFGAAGHVNGNNDDDNEGDEDEDDEDDEDMYDSADDSHTSDHGAYSDDDGDVGQSSSRGPSGSSGQRTSANMSPPTHPQGSATNSVRGAQYSHSQHVRHHEGAARGRGQQQQQVQHEKRLRQARQTQRQQSQQGQQLPNMLIAPGGLRKTSSSANLLANAEGFASATSGVGGGQSGTSNSNGSKNTKQKKHVTLSIPVARGVAIGTFQNLQVRPGRAGPGHIVSAPVQLHTSPRHAHHSVFAGGSTGLQGAAAADLGSETTSSVQNDISAAGQAAIIHDLQKIKAEVAYLQFLQGQVLQNTLTRQQAQEFTADTTRARQLLQRQSQLSQSTARTPTEADGPRPTPVLWGRHAGSVNAVAVFDDGQTVATGGSDRLIRIWRDGVCMNVLAGHTDKVLSLLCLGSKMLVSGSADHTVRIWDINPACPGSGRCRRTLAGHRGAVNSITKLSETHFVSGGEDGAIRVWSVNAEASAALEIVPPSSIAPGRVRSVICLPGIKPPATGNSASGGASNRKPCDDTRLFASSEGGTLHFWSVLLASGANQQQLNEQGESPLTNKGNATNLESLSPSDVSKTPATSSLFSTADNTFSNIKDEHAAALAAVEIMTTPPPKTASARLIRSCPDAHGRRTDLQTLVALGDGTLLSAGDNQQLRRWDWRRAESIATATTSASFRHVWSAAAFGNGSWVCGSPVQVGELTQHCLLRSRNVSVCFLPAIGGRRVGIHGGDLGAKGGHALRTATRGLGREHVPARHVCIHAPARQF